MSASGRAGTSVADPPKVSHALLGANPEPELAGTSQSATWYLCFEARLQGVTRRYYVENKGYEKNQVTIPVALELPLSPVTVVVP